MIHYQKYLTCRYFYLINASYIFFMNKKLLSRTLEEVTALHDANVKRDTAMPLGKILSVEEAQAHLKIPDTFRDPLPTLFGIKNLRRFKELLEHPDLVAMDIAMMTCSLSREELEQYRFNASEILPIFLELRNVLKQMVINLAKSGRIEFYIRKSFEVVYKNGVKQCRLSSEKGISQLLGLIDSLKASYFCDGRRYDYQPSHRNNIFNLLQYEFRGMVFEETMRAFDNIHTNDLPAVEGGKHSLRVLATELFQKSSNRIHHCFDHNAGKNIFQKVESFSAYLISKKTGEIFVADQDFHQALRKEYEDLSMEELLDSNKRQLLEIDKLVLEKKIDDSKTEITDNYSITINLNNFLGAKERNWKLIMDVLVLFVDNTVDPDSGEQNVNWMQLFLEKGTGKLLTAAGDGFDLEEKMDKRTLECLKARVYGMLLEKLQASGDILIDLLIAPIRTPEKIERLMNKVSDDTQAVVLNEKEENDSTLVDQAEKPKERWITKVWRKVTGRKEEGVTDTRATTSVAVQQQLKVSELYPGIDFDRFKNIDAEKAYRIIVSLLGEPIRIHGSHHIFEDKNVGTCPIPFHFGKEVNRNILISFLKHFGLIELFYEKL